MSAEPQTHTHLFGQVAKDLGLITDAQIAAALEKQQSMREHSAKSRLGEVLMFMSVLTLEQVRKVVSEQRKRRQHDADKLVPSELFGDFRLIEKLGEGGMGAVYKAQDVLAERVVALKVLRRSIAGSVDFAQRFDREAKMAGALNHPNIVSCYSAGTVRGVQYLAMELVDGQSLALRMHAVGGKFPETESLKIIRDVARALAHAQQKGLVHRDVKPDNILLAKDGTVKLADFGTAKSFLNEDSLSQTGLVIGTPHYISPEQVRGEKDVDHRADLYALGGTFYHLVTGKFPFDAPSPMEVMRAHLQDELENPLDINPELSANTAHIISHLMAKARDDRYDDAAQLIEDLDRVLSGENPIHATKHMLQSSIRPPRRKAKPKAAGCLSIVLLAVMLSLAIQNI